jgi:hypothetical protein
LHNLGLRGQGQGERTKDRGGLGGRLADGHGFQAKSRVA